eukprot:7851179-Lingulodinium_polyedra.AAC.1
MARTHELQGLREQGRTPVLATRRDSHFGAGSQPVGLGRPGKPQRPTRCTLGTKPNLPGQTQRGPNSRGA